MNKQGPDKISYLDFTWNPITGCLHGCEYCYARRIVHRFSTQTASLTGGVHDLKKMGGTIYPFGFDPTFHRYRLDEPQKVKKPSIIGVVFMGDLFGNWVPDEWIQDVFAACEAAPQHTYMFLTKNPGRYLMLAYRGALPQGENYWWGATITNQSEYDSKGIALLNLPESHRTFFSIEPIHEPIEMGLMPNWIITGAETGNRKNKTKPQREWIEDIVRRCVAESIFMKNSLKDIWGAPLIQEWPEGVKGGTDNAK